MDASGNPEQSDSAAQFETKDATHRTLLATERTQLAWWRTGLTALAVGVGIGRVIPGLGGTGARWPYAVVGAAFALYGIALIAVGNLRASAVEGVVRIGRFSRSPAWIVSVLTGAGVALGILTLVVVVID